MTPMMEQYQAMKTQYKDAILFFRLGDFYEMFFDDAVEASRLLGLTLTARNKGEHRAPMCGIPYHAADGYIAKLTRVGKKVAICEQLSDPNLPGIVKRDVIRVITPGTTLDDHVLDQKSNNYLLALTYRNDLYEIAFADLSTGECRTATLESSKALQTEIERIAPAEIVLPTSLFEHFAVKALRNRHGEIFFFPVETFSENGASDILMEYLKNTQKTALRNIGEVEPYDIGSSMLLDEATLQNLELLTTLRENKKEGSLLWVVDSTISAMGGRLLRQFITHPLTSAERIQERLDAVESFFQNQRLLGDVREELKAVLDLERLSSRLSLGHGNARDLIGLKSSLQAVPRIAALLQGNNAALVRSVAEGLDPLDDLVTLIERAIVAEPPLGTNEGGMITDGYHTELDELKKISRDGKSCIQQMQQREIERTGINTLKIRFNRVFGYSIEISKGQIKNVPADYIRKQTLVNAERFITPELKEFEEKVLGAEEKIIALEFQLFAEIRERVAENIQRIQRTSKHLALIDVLGTFAFTALQNRYVKPEITNDGNLSIVGGRHPVVEKMSYSGRFIPNDTVLEQDAKRLMLITGPNMGGKSTYLRQVALIVLLAQIGCYVPATSARVGIVDRIFTRVGASDNLVRGQSTFMVEMQETSNILSNATKNSLIILDEIGRGTSTYDGMSIAWAIMEYLHDTVQAKTLFATHYHELITLADKLEHSLNCSVAVKEEDDGIVFLYKILPGGVDRSYGIEVAKLAGLPGTVVAKAYQILTELEEGVLESGIKQELQLAGRGIDANQIDLFEREQQPLHETHVSDVLRSIDLDSLTPLEALNTLADIKKKLH